MTRIGLPAGVGRWLRAAESALQRLRDRLTPGQRWTSALSIALALLVLFAGLPTDVEVLPMRRSDGSERPPTGSGSPAQYAPTPASRQATIVVPSAGPGAAPAVPPVQPADVQRPFPATPRVAALVRAGGLPGRDDAAMAAAFLEGAGFDAEVVVADGDASDVCDSLRRAGDLVIASVDVDPDVHRCVTGAGGTILSFDGLGSPVSTRRGITDSIADLGRWGAGDALRGTVGVVGSAAARDAITAGVDALRKLDVEVAATAFLEDGAPATAEVLAFADAGIEVVLFAAPVELQRRWIAQQAVLGGGVRYVVSDAFDAIVQETYPPVFDASLAHTSIRGPWSSRLEGETASQRVCRTTWEEAAGAPMLTSERVPVFAWCQHVAMAGAALDAMTGGASLHEALLGQRVLSPLTSDLGPQPDGGYGPTADAVLVWRAACGCWEAQRGFTPR